MRGSSAPARAASPRSRPSTSARCRSSRPCRASASAAASAWPGNADVIVAAEDATFGLPEVDRGALGAATHLARLVPQPLMRAMVYTCQTVTARQLLSFGTVLEVVPAGELRAAARDLAATIAAKDPARHPAGEAVAERHRPGRRQALLPLRAGVHLRAQPGRRRGPGAAGVRGRAPLSESAVMTPDEIVAELRDGMTIGIGGWGSRRKPMALVRAILRSPLRDLTDRVLRGPGRGAARRVGPGAADRHRLRVARLDRARAAFQERAAERDRRADRAGRGHAALGAARRRPPAAVPADPGRPRLGRDAGQPRAADGPLAVPGREHPAARNWSRCRRCGSTRRSCT